MMDTHRCGLRLFGYTKQYSGYVAGSSVAKLDLLFESVSVFFLHDVTRWQLIRIVEIIQEELNTLFSLKALQAGLLRLIKGLKFQRRGYKLLSCLETGIYTFAKLTFIETWCIS